MTATDRLVKQYWQCQRHGLAMRFSVGRYTGNGVSCVAALRRRGFTVVRLAPSRYEITASPPDPT